MSETDIALELPAMRVSYEQGALDESQLAATWHEQLQLWLDAARGAGLPEANAMVLATADPAGRPSSRTVLCKGIDQRGVVFFTNYTSTKSHDLLATRFASATFPWFAMQRQATYAARWRRSARPRRPPTGPAGHAARSWVPGPRRSPGR